jgi:hypothetical protein
MQVLSALFLPEPLLPELFLERLDLFLELFPLESLPLEDKQDDAGQN